MKSRILTLLLGSNLGAREENLCEAERLLNRVFGTRPLARSGVLETKAVGFTGPDFLNGVLCYPCRRRPETVLRLCKEIERQMGREEGPLYDEKGLRIYRNRLIDIDILLYGDLTRDMPSLVIPHPQIRTRLFVRTLLDELSARTALQLSPLLCPDAPSCGDKGTKVQEFV